MCWFSDNQSEILKIFEQTQLGIENPWGRLYNEETEELIEKPKNRREKGHYQNIQTITCKNGSWKP